MFVICSAFVISSITKASARVMHVVKIRPLAWGFSLLPLQLREVEAVKTVHACTLWTQTLQFMGEVFVYLALVLA